MKDSKYGFVEVQRKKTTTVRLYRIMSPEGAVVATAESEAEAVRITFAINDAIAKAYAAGREDAEIRV